MSEPEDLASVQDVDVDPDDRHVLAAALSADADILLTDNTLHFPREWMAEHGIALLNSGTLLVRLAETFPDRLLAAHRQTVRFSPKSEAEILATLQLIVGESVTDTIRTLAERQV